jgi:hypothetical protein
VDDNVRTHSATRSVGFVVKLSKRQAAANRKNSERSAAAARQKKMFNLLRKKEPLIPLSVLRALTASELPLSVDAYNKRLQELLLEA